MVVRKRNKSGEPLNVPALGFPGSPRHVEPGEVVDVPDELAGAAWPPELWEDVVDANADANADRTVEDLKADLKALGLPTSGTKQELLDRLAAAHPEAPSEGPGEVA